MKLNQIQPTTPHIEGFVRFASETDGVEQRQLDHFEVLARHHNGDGGSGHPALAQHEIMGALLPPEEKGKAKLCTIPIKLICDAPENSLTARYEAFDTVVNRMTCAGDGEKGNRAELTTGRIEQVIVSITPMLTKLSTDDLRGLLSPDYDDLEDTRPIMDMMRVVRGNHILYVGTDTLADPSVGHALAAMLLADGSAVAAEIYNHGIEGDDGVQPRRIHVFADEWGDVMCEPMVQQANKGRGAGIFIWALGQTVADLIDAFGGAREKALRFLGNMNNLIVGATQDTETMKLITEMFGETSIQVRSVSQSTGSKTEDTGLEFSVNRGETSKDMDTELFPPSLLPGMPDLQYVAKLNRSELIKGRIPVLQLK